MNSVTPSPATKSFPGEGFNFGHDLVLRHPYLYYFGGICLVSATLLTLIGAATSTVNVWLMPLVLLTALLPVSELAVGLVNFVTNLFVPPRTWYAIDNPGPEPLRTVSACCPEDPTREIGGAEIPSASSSTRRRRKRWMAAEWSRSATASTSPLRSANPSSPAGILRAERGSRSCRRRAARAAPCRAPTREPHSP